MKFLSFDYGRKKLGVAYSQGSLADPLVVLRGETRQELLKKALDVISVEKPDRLIVGLSERDIAVEAEEFGRELELVSHVKVSFVDETLSTFDASQLAIASGMRRKKRHDMEDAFSAAVILQRYLDGDAE
jgi:putative transcription antitermination factor YqgF